MQTVILIVFNWLNWKRMKYRTELITTFTILHLPNDWSDSCMPSKCMNDLSKMIQQNTMRSWAVRTYYGNFLFQVIQILATLLLGWPLLILVLSGGHTVAVWPSILQQKHKSQSPCLSVKYYFKGPVQSKKITTV